MSTKNFYIVLAAVLVVSLAIALVMLRYGHRMGPGFGGPPMVMLPEGHASMVKANSQGVFILIGNKLVKYNIDGLKTKNELKIEIPTVSKNAMPPPPLPAMFDTVRSSAGVESVLVLTGNKMLVIDPTAFKVRQKVTLPSPPIPAAGMMGPMGPGGPPPGMQGMGGSMGPEGPCQGMLGIGDQMGPGGPPPGMQGIGRPGLASHGSGQPASGFTVSGDVVYLLRGPQLLGVNYVTGKIVGKTELPLPK